MEANFTFVQDFLRLVQRVILVGNRHGLTLLNLDLKQIFEKVLSIIKAGLDKNLHAEDYFDEFAVQFQEVPPFFVIDGTYALNEIVMKMNAQDSLSFNLIIFGIFYNLIEYMNSQNCEALRNIFLFCADKLLFSMQRMVESDFQNLLAVKLLDETHARLFAKLCSKKNDLMHLVPCLEANKASHIGFIKVYVEFFIFYFKKSCTRLNEHMVENLSKVFGALNYGQNDSVLIYSFVLEKEHFYIFNSLFLNHFGDANYALFRAEKHMLQNYYKTLAQIVSVIFPAKTDVLQQFFAKIYEAFQADFTYGKNLIRTVIQNLKGKHQLESFVEQILQKVLALPLFENCLKILVILLNNKYYGPNEKAYLQALKAETPRLLENCKLQLSANFASEAIFQNSVQFLRVVNSLVQYYDTYPREVNAEMFNIYQNLVSHERIIELFQNQVLEANLIFEFLHAYCQKISERELAALAQNSQLDFLFAFIKPLNYLQDSAFLNIINVELKILNLKNPDVIAQFVEKLKSHDAFYKQFHVVFIEAFKREQFIVEKCFNLLYHLYRLDPLLQQNIENCVPSFKDELAVVGSHFQESLCGKSLFLGKCQIKRICLLLNISFD